MKRERIIAEVDNAEDAKKLEETVKTGYAESSIETLTNWMGVEEDLVSSYDRLASKENDPVRRLVYQRLGTESKANIERLSGIRGSLEELDRGRVERIKSLGDISRLDRS
jgi:hypothetical protein